MHHQRRAGRVVLLDSTDRVLLLQGHDPAIRASRWWFTPGGGAESSESVREAAIRELFEETGLILADLQGPIWRRNAKFIFNGDHYEQDEEFFFARIDTHQVDTSRWTPLEQESVLTTHWWSLAELVATEETIYPEGFATLVAQLLDLGLPSAPVELRSQQ